MRDMLGSRSALFYFMCGLANCGSSFTTSRQNRKKWSFATGGHVTTPSVSPNGDIVYIASEDMNVYALNANTGKQLWAWNATKVLETEPCCDGHMHGITMPIVSPDGQAVYVRAGLGFFGLHARNGSLKFFWNMFDQMVGNPTVSPDSKTLYVASQSYEEKVICALDLTLNLSNYFDWQQCRWLRRTWTSTAPVVSPDGKTIYYGGNGGNASALTASDGSLKWGFYVYIEDVGQMVPSLDGKTVFLQYVSGSSYFALNTADGSQKWNYSYLSTGTTPAIDPHGHTVFVGLDGLGVEVRSPDGTLRPANSTIVALDASTGKEKWNFNTTTTQAFWSGTPLATLDTVYFGTSTEGIFRAVNAVDGTERFSFAMNMSSPDSTVGQNMVGGSSPCAAVTPDGRTVFVASKDDNSLYALDTSQESQLFV